MHSSAYGIAPPELNGLAGYPLETSGGSRRIRGGYAEDSRGLNGTLLLLQRGNGPGVAADEGRRGGLGLQRFQGDGAEEHVRDRQDDVIVATRLMVMDSVVLAVETKSARALEPVVPRRVDEEVDRFVARGIGRRAERRTDTCRNAEQPADQQECRQVQRPEDRD